MIFESPIKDPNQLEFVVFCIENIAVFLGMDAEKIYEALAEKSNILNSYIVPCYEILHTQSKGYNRGYERKGCIGMILYGRK